VKIFDPGKFNFNQEIPLQNKQLPLEKPKPENTALEKSSSKKNYFNGTLLNSSDSELMKDHLEQYLPTDSLRLEIQMERLSGSILQIEKDLNALTLLPESELKTNQQQLLESKRDNILARLNHYKDEYRNISPLHRFALWLKDKFTPQEGISEKLTSIIYGDKGVFLNNIKSANNSLQLIVDQVGNNKRGTACPEETHRNVIDLINQFDRIESEIEASKIDYFRRHGPRIMKEGQRLFQKFYYGYELPEKRDTDIV
jgi:hypothetical protein